jgi:putative spermidine/putrescine transport system permease protein
MVLDRTMLGRVARWLLLGSLVVYILLPIVAVVLYAFATRWTAHILPDGYTASHWSEAFQDPRLVEVTIRTFMLALVVTLLDILLIVPAIYWQWTQNPKIRAHLELTAAIPFVLPYVVIAFGILTLSGQFAPAAQGTVWLLALGHVAIAFPFFYWAVDSAMAAANIPLLNEAAKTCGASPFVTLWKVVLPNIGAGIATGSMLVFAVSFNEFALVQILVGARYETISLYSLDLLTGANADFNKLAVITIITFLIVFTISAISVYLNRGQSQTSRLITGAKFSK